MQTQTRKHTERERERVSAWAACVRACMWLYVCVWASLAVMWERWRVDVIATHITTSKRRRKCGVWGVRGQHSNSLSHTDNAMLSMAWRCDANACASSSSDADAVAVADAYSDSSSSNYYLRINLIDSEWKSFAARQRARVTETARARVTLVLLLLCALSKLHWAKLCKTFKQNNLQLWKKNC